MDRKISISTENFEIEAALLQGERPETCDAIWDALPFDGEAKFYHEEVYFDIPVEIGPENATPKTEKGDISYWPMGPAFCIFYGDSQPVSPVNTFARAKEGIEKFDNLNPGETVRVEKSE